VVRYARLALAAMLTIAAGCNSDRQASARLRLAGGDAARGKAAFAALGCPECHAVAGLDPPRSAALSSAPALGGTVNYRPSAGRLASSIVYKAAESRMPHYADRMTVQQLTDIVVFLQAQYTERLVVPPLTPY
jgi:mono/diheme cytochrome c family protein